MEEVSEKDMIHKHAIKSFQDTKCEQRKLKETVANQKNIIENLYETYHRVCKFVTQMSELGQIYLKKLISITEQYQDEYILSHERQIKLDFYEKSKGFTKMSDSDLIKLEDYIVEFKKNLKGETDRRTLLKKHSLKHIDLPEEAIYSLELPEKNEERETKTQLTLFKERLDKFVQFKEGAESEIDYYNQINKDFHEQTDINVKVSELEDIIYHDYEITDQRVIKLDKQFKEVSDKMESSYQVK